MRRANQGRWLVTMLALCTLACVEQKPVKVATPPTPTPVVKAPQPPPDPAPVIATQNVAKLPEAQPIPAGAVPVHELPPVPTVTADREPAAPARTTPSRTVTSQPVRSPTTEPTTPAPTQSAPETAEEPPLAPRLEPSSRATVRSATDIRGTINEVDGLIKQLRSRALDAESKSVLDRVQSMVRLARDAIKKGTLAQADDLINRAASMARDLARRQ